MLVYKIIYVALVFQMGMARASGDEEGMARIHSQFFQGKARIHSQFFQGKAG
jgi:hypothetical protein